MTTTEQMHTVADLERLLRLSGRTIRGDIERGRFGRDVVRHGRAFLVPSSGVELWKRQHAAFDRDGALRPLSPEMRPPRRFLSLEVAA